MRVRRRPASEPVITPSNDSALQHGYGCGLVLALAVAIGFAFVHGPLLAMLGLLVALPILHLFYVSMKRLVFPAVEVVSRAVGKTLDDE